MKHDNRHRLWGETADPSTARAMRGEGLKGYGRRGVGRGAEQSDGGGRGRRRMFEGGELRLVLLLLMEREPRHGYDLIREIETRTNGAYAPSPGIVYPTLTLLEEIGQIEARTIDGARKLFGITEAGAAHLAENRSEAEAALSRLDQLRSQSAAFDAGPVFRAMGNLKTVLRQKLTDQTDKQILFSVADLIDEAARKIERL